MTLDGNQNFDKEHLVQILIVSISIIIMIIFIIVALSFPCGSVAGTPGYMCAKQLTRNEKNNEISSSAR